MEPALRSALRLAPTLALGMTGFLGGSSLVWGVGVSELVQRYGLTPVEPPRPAADFELPRLGGGTTALSDYLGRWTVLTFWASWCGPCRAEMPSLETIHRQYADKGVVVLGVTVDRTEAAAQGFVDRYGLTFPQLWDRQGAVGTTYEASAIPLSYVVDPAGRIVGLARGARDWTQLAGMLEELGGIASLAADAGEGVYAQGQDRGAIVSPPTAEVALSELRPTIGEPFHVEVRLEWAGRADDYMPHPPKLLLPDGIVEKGVTASSSSRDGARVVVYRIDLVGERSGEFALDPIELEYQPTAGSELATSQIPGPTVMVEPRTVLGLRPTAFAGVLGGVMVVGAAGLFLSRRRSSAEGSEVETEQRRLEDLSARFDAARQLRLQGDAAGFGLAMLDLLDDFADTPSESAEARRQLREGWQFGGQRPSAAEMDRLQRQVGRRIESLRPDPTAAARAAVKLNDDEEME